MSSLEKLVPVLDGSNYRDWSVMMMSYLQLQELWEVVDGNLRIPTAPTPTTAADGTTTAPTRAVMAAYNEEYAKWNTADNKATGAITLRVHASLRHYRTANQSARTFWANLRNAFGAASMSAIYADFKAVIGTKLSGGNPISEMERMATLFGRLATNQVVIAPQLQALVLLSALPAKWDSIAQLFMQRTDLNHALTFSNVRAAITQEYERQGRPIDKSAHKLSAVKRKGPDPAHCQQQQPQQQPGTSRQHQQQSQQQGGKPKRRGGRQEREKKEKRARKTAEHHDHSHFASISQLHEVVEPPAAPTFINASQPSRAAPHHSTVASFGKNGIEYRKVASTAPTKPTLASSVWPSLNEAREMCEQFAIPKTAKNLKPLETPNVAAPIFPRGDPFESYRKAQKKVDKMIDMPVATTSRVQLSQRLTTPPSNPSPDLEHFSNYEESGFDWASEPYPYREESREPSVSLGSATPTYNDPYNFDESDSDDDAPRQIGTLEMRMNVDRSGYRDWNNPEHDVDDDIAEAAGFSAKDKGKQKERQVPLSRNKLLLTTSQCTTGSTSAVQAKEEPLGSDVDYRCALQALVNSLNKIELHTQKCEKCKHRITEEKAWILDSGASQHFTSTKEDFIDYEIVKNAGEVRTASAKAILRVEGKGSILLTHFVENKCRHIVKTMRIYPVLYIPGLSVKLLSMGSFL